MGLNYYYLVLRNGQGLLELAWLVAITLLMMGGVAAGEGEWLGAVHTRYAG